MQRQNVCGPFQATDGTAQNTQITTNVFSDCLSCRQVLNIMVILGFMLNYMLRMNLTIAIVSMVIQSNSSGQHSHSNGSASMPDECGAQAMMMNDLTPINDTRTPVIDVNRVNEMNSSSGFTASPFVRIRTVTMYNTPVRNW